MLKPVHLCGELVPFALKRRNAAISLSDRFRGGRSYRRRGGGSRDGRRGGAAEGVSFAVVVSVAASFETPLEPDGGFAKSLANAKSCGRNLSQLSSSAKCAASSLDGFWRNRSRRSSSRLQASSCAADAPSAADGAEGGGAVSPANFVPGSAPFGPDAPSDCTAWPRLSKRAKSCGCNLEHLNSSAKLETSLIEGLA